jgi:hypothetical protein
LRWLFGLPTLVAVVIVLIVTGHPWLALFCSGGVILFFLTVAAALIYRRFTNPP